jgi:hypothetical protein
MMNFINIRKYINPAFLLVVIIVLMFVSQIIKHNNNHQKKAPELFSTETFKTGKGGFGYLIKLNDKVIIKQENIPAISTKISFKTEKDALKTAGLVVQKIRNKKVPSVTPWELDSLKIDVR